MESHVLQLLPTWKDVEVAKVAMVCGNVHSKHHYTYKKLQPLIYTIVQITAAGRVHAAARPEHQEATQKTKKHDASNEMKLHCGGFMLQQHRQNGFIQHRSQCICRRLISLSRHNYTESEDIQFLGAAALRRRAELPRTGSSSPFFSLGRM